MVKISANLSIVKGPCKLLMSSKLASSIVQFSVSLFYCNYQLIQFVREESTGNTLILKAEKN